MEVVASLSEGRTAAAQCGLFTHKSVPVIFEPPCTTTVTNIYIFYHLPRSKVAISSRLRVFQYGFIPNVIT